VTFIQLQAIASSITYGRALKNMSESMQTKLLEMKMSRDGNEMGMTAATREC